MTIARRIEALHAQIEAARTRAGTHRTVHLLAVSKTHSARAVQDAYEAGAHLGIRAFGENYVQEAVSKISALAHLRAQIEWHLIGPLQGNKTSLAAQHFDWVQTVESTKTAQRLSAQRPAHLPALNVCIQVNVDAGPTKSGLRCLETGDQDLQPLWALATQIATLPRLRLRGLMAIPEPQADTHAQQQVFAKVHSVYAWLQGRLSAQACTAHVQLDTLSMGMSADFEVAIAAGSTMVRIGSALFGARHTSH